MVLCSSTLVWADNPCQAGTSPYAPTNCSAGTVPSLQTDGAVNMVGTTVKQATSINGAFNAKNTNLSDLTVNGAVAMTDSVVQGVVNVQGVFNATNTHFAKAMTLATNSATLADCQLMDLTINNSPDGVVSPQTITLTGKSVVQGDIHFATTGGLVIIAPTVTITGTVYGGTIRVISSSVNSTIANSAINQ